MAKERVFVKEGIREMEVEEFLAKKFEKAGYSHTEIQRTPLGIRMVVYAQRPGLVIGRSGRRIRDITEEVKKKFGFENPMIDAREVEQPFLDANIIARRVANALERGINFKKVANYYLNKVTEAGAVGIQINVAGKVTGSERSRFQKFRKGFVAHSGDYAETLVEKGYAQAIVRSGTIGVQIKIMKKTIKEFELKVKEFKHEKEIKNSEENPKEKSDIGEK